MGMALPTTDEADPIRRAVAARQIEVLEAARHPGVVELLGVDEGPDGPVARTAALDGQSLDRLPSLGAEEVAGMMAAVASTLADLHDIGLVHGGLTAEQVVVGTDGRPVLLGFGHGGRIGEPPVAEAVLPAEAADPARVAGAPLDPASDVFALGALLRTLLDGAGRERQRGRGGDAFDALRSLADRAMVADPRLRLSARALSAAIGHAVPGARLPRRSGSPGPSVGPPAAADPLLALRRRGRSRSAVPLGRRRPSLAAAGAVGAVAVAVLCLIVLRRPASAPAPRVPPAPPRTENSGTETPRAQPPTSAGPTTAGTRSTTSVDPAGRAPATTVPAARACPEVDAVLAADTDSDGCPEALRWADGVVEAGSERWAVGRPGDLVATGDWACQGTTTLALLRPGSGEVFVFDGWAGPGAELAATALARVEGAFALRTADLDADGCPELLVERTGGSPVPVARPSRGP